MKHKVVLAVMCGILVMGAALGATGAIQLNGGETSRGNKGEEIKSTDRFCGCLLTEEPLSEEKIYATLETISLSDGENGEESVHQEYVFATIDGIPMYTNRINNGDLPYYTSSVMIVSDVTSKYGNSDEFETDISLSGTLYVCGEEGERILYVNPVYQTKDDEVYVVPGEGIYLGRVESGFDASTSLEATSVLTEKGKKTDYRLKMDLAIKGVGKPETMHFIEMGEDHQVIKTTTYKNGEVPEQYAPSAHTAYILVETEYSFFDGSTKVERKLAEKEAAYANTLYWEVGGYVSKKDTELLWA